MCGSYAQAQVGARAYEVAVSGRTVHLVHPQDGVAGRGSMQCKVPMKNGRRYGRNARIRGCSRIFSVVC